MIDKIGGINPNFNTRKSEPVVKKESLVRTDNVEISAEAAQAADLAQTIKLVQSTEEPSRQEKLAEVRARLARGDYDQPNAEMLDEIAESISQSFIGTV